MSVVRVLVADAHAVVREGLKVVLNARSDTRVVGEAADGPSAVALAAALNPDVVITEVSLPRLDGGLVRLCEAAPGRRVVVLTAREEETWRRAALAAGARGYVLKRESLVRLVEAIHTVADGGTSLGPDAPGPTDGAGEPAAGGPDGVWLSEREAEVVRLVALGYCNKEIAARLKVSVKTVETYKGRAMEKLRATNRVGVVRYALRRGWLTAD